MTPTRVGSGVSGMACLGLVLALAGTSTAQAPRMKGVPGKAVVKAARPKDATGADVVTLRDGTLLRGQIFDPSPRGSLLVIVGRAWAKANLPDWYERWAKVEGEPSAQAELHRRDRLLVWRRDRMTAPGVAAEGDRINAWLDRQLAKPVGPGEPSPLMVARLTRPGEVKGIDRRGMAAARALRLGWQLGLKDVEVMPLDDLRDALAGRGLVPEGDTPISLDALLPKGAESESQWLARRAATELAYDQGLRFVRHGNTLMAEPGPGQAPDPAAAARMLGGALQDLLGNPAGDPLTAQLRDVAARGRVGAVVTELSVAADLDSVSVVSRLYVRQPDGSWAQVVARAGNARAREVGQGAADALAEDPQVKSALGLMESFGLGQVSDEMKRKSLAVGAMTRKALGSARSALAQELSIMALPLDVGADPAREPKPGTKADPPKP